MAEEIRNPPATQNSALGAAELRQEERYEQEPMEARETAKAFRPADIRPQHADGAETPQHHRQAAGSREHLTPERCRIERGQDGHKPE